MNSCKFWLNFRMIAGPLILKISHSKPNIVQSWYSQLKKMADKSFGRMFKMRDIVEKDPENFSNVKIN